MRTSIDIPDTLMKKAKIKAVQEGISLKQLIMRSLEKELAGGQSVPASAPWKSLYGMGSSASITPDKSGFDHYSGPDWLSGTQANEPE